MAGSEATRIATAATKIPNFALINLSPCSKHFRFPFPGAESISPHSFLAILWTVPDRVVDFRAMGRRAKTKREAKRDSKKPSVVEIQHPMRPAPNWPLL